MNNRILSAQRIAFVLLILVTLGCGASAEAVATEAAESIPTEVAVTEELTEAAIVPDLSTTRVPVYDLPKGFEEVSSDTFETSFPVSGKEFKPEVIFSYVNGREFQLVMGMNFLLTDVTDRQSFDLALSQPESTLNDVVDYMSDDTLREHEITKVLDGVGETQIAMTMITDIEKVPYRVNMGFFRRGVVGGMIMSMTMVGQQESVSLRELGILFDKRIQWSLESAQ